MSLATTTIRTARTATRRSTRKVHVAEVQPVGLRESLDRYFGAIKADGRSIDQQTTDVIRAIEDTYPAETEKMDEPISLTCEHGSVTLLPAWMPQCRYQPLERLIVIRMQATFHI